MNKDKARLEELLGELEFPGENEAFRARSESSRLTDSVLQRLASASPAYPGSSFSKAAISTASTDQLSLTTAVPVRRRTIPWYWIGAALINVVLLLFFGMGGTTAASLILGESSFYSSMVFLFLGLSTSVSLAGTVLTIDSQHLRRFAAAIHLGG